MGQELQGQRLEGRLSLACLGNACVVGVRLEGDSPRRGGGRCSDLQGLGAQTASMTDGRHQGWGGGLKQGMKGQRRGQDGSEGAEPQSPTQTPSLGGAGREGEECRVLGPGGAALSVSVPPPPPFLSASSPGLPCRNLNSLRHLPFPVSLSCSPSCGPISRECSLCSQYGLPWPSALDPLLIALFPLPRSPWPPRC